MMDNLSVVTVFTLSGLSGTENFRVTLFVFTFLCYCVIWLVNVTIVVAIIVDKNLHEPMYIFLCNLCINGLYGTAGFYPKFLHDLCSNTHIISVPGCCLQGFVLHSSICADFSFLALMAYDRYMAICRPLVYHSVMTKQRVCIYGFIAWLIPFFLMLLSTITTATATSRLCGSHIPKIYCINFLISKLACSASVASTVVPGFNYAFYVGHVIFIVWSYFYLIQTCQTSKENRQKFLQTCVPHLFSLAVAVASFFLDILYIRLGSMDLSQNVQNFLAIEIFLFPPLINPLIYGFRLTQLRKSVLSLLCSKGPVFRLKP